MWILGLKGLRHIKREKASLPVDVCLPKTCLLKLINRELKQLRRRPQRRLQKNNRFTDQKNFSASTSRFLVHFFDVHYTNEWSTGWSTQSNSKHQRNILKPCCTCRAVVLLIKNNCFLTTLSLLSSLGLLKLPNATSGAPNENTVQNHLKITLSNVFQYSNSRYRNIFIP